MLSSSCRSCWSTIHCWNCRTHFRILYYSSLHNFHPCTVCASSPFCRNTGPFESGRTADPFDSGRIADSGRRHSENWLRCGRQEVQSGTSNLSSWEERWEVHLIHCAVVHCRNTRRCNWGVERSSPENLTSEESGSTLRPAAPLRRPSTSVLYSSTTDLSF